MMNNTQCKNKNNWNPVGAGPRACPDTALTLFLHQPLHEVHRMTIAYTNIENTYAGPRACPDTALIPPCLPFVPTTNALPTTKKGNHRGLPLRVFG
jgi:hypothetical protein